MKVLLLFSGGLDSMLLAEQLLADDDIELAVVHYRYPHPAAPREYEAVARWAVQHNDTERYWVSLPIAAPQMDIGAGTPGPRVVPHRNLVMLSHAVHMADTIGAKRVYIGCNHTDEHAYVDCRRGYLIALNSMLAESGIQVVAPLINQSKQDILAAARELGLSGWWSCYQPDGSRPCGTCNACLEVAK